MKKLLMYSISASLVTLCSCAINGTLDKWSLKNESTFDGESGVVGVIQASFSGTCDSETGEIMLYGPDGKKEQIDFTMNSLFASYLVPGEHKIERVRYRCNFSTPRGTTINYLTWLFDSENMYAKDMFYSEASNSVTKTFVIHGSASITVPENGFCKFAVNPESTGKWSGDSKTLKSDKIALNVEQIPSCGE
jgi:hypothetical protein